jgi:hypothetical protein
VIDRGGAGCGFLDPPAEPVVGIRRELAAAGKEHVVGHHVAGGVVGEAFGIDPGDPGEPVGAGFVGVSVGQGVDGFCQPVTDIVVSIRDVTIYAGCGFQPVQVVVGEEEKSTCPLFLILPHAEKNQLVVLGFISFNPTYAADILIALLMGDSLSCSS